MKKENVKKEKVEKKVQVKPMEKKQKSLITSRVLFISVLDKIYLIMIGVCFLIGTFSIFNGHIGNLNYGFWARVGREIIFLIILFVIYLFMNWFYRCAAKTMLCLTKNEVYKEHYIPFKRSETSVPLNKITAVSAINFFWIFRCVIIHQYHRFPMVFFTWTNQEFKDQLNELITTDKEHIENEFESRNIITKEMYKFVGYVGMALIAIIVLLGFVRLFTYLFNGERKMAGTYTYENNKLILNKNGSCSIEGFADKVTECSWDYNSDNKEVKINYEYEYSYYYSRYTSTNTSSITLKYNANDKSLEYRDMKLTK